MSYTNQPKRHRPKIVASPKIKPEETPMPKNFDSWPDQHYNPEEFGEEDFPDWKEVEPVIQDLYRIHPELMGDPNAWIQTYSGKKFYPQHPTNETIDIIDIAHALSQQCRFTGHTKYFYSVAQHSLLVSYLCQPENALFGLLHDASEAYICDISSPIKRLTALATYRALEKVVQQAICIKFGLPVAEPKDVKQADLMVLSLEANSFLSPLHPEWKMSVNIPTLIIDPLPCHEAKQMFLNRFEQLSSANANKMQK
jgi:uncharacterized protein